MKTEDGMNIHERRKYLRLTQKRYRKASRKGKAQLLDEMGTVTGMHRKTLVRLMNSDLERKPRRKQRGRSYGVQVHYALKVISESVDHICAERVQPNLTWLAEHLARHGELETTPNSWPNWARSASRQYAEFKPACSRISLVCRARDQWKPIKLPGPFPSAV